MNDFSVAADSIRVQFACPSCKRYVSYRPTSLPVPDYSAERDADSEQEMEDSVSCEYCGAQYEVNIHRSMTSGAVIVLDKDYHEVENVEVEEEYELPQEDEEDYVGQLDSLSIQRFWREYDVNVKFNPDVTIITGGNGSGKTTLLRLIYSSLHDSRLESSLARKVGKMRLELSNGVSVNHSRVLLVEQAEAKRFFSKPVTSFEKNGKPLSFGDVRQMVSCELISSFDAPIDAGKYSSLLQTEGMTSELDLLLKGIENEYSGYLGELGMQVETLGLGGGNNESNGMLQDIVASRNKFYDIIDEFFAETGKTISRKDSKFLFNKAGRPFLTWKDLSSGEKQVLYIFVKVLLQRQAPVVMLMDEPEISMHVDWQEKLIEKILELNDNCQLVIATHSPSVVSLKWRGFVVNMDDIKERKLL